MTPVIEGNLNSGNARVAIIVSRWNDLITSRLLDGALGCLRRHGVSDDAVDIIWVPGAFELPLVTKAAAKSGKYTGLICLGAVIRGATPHFDYVCSQASAGIQGVALEYEVPVGFGLLTTDTIEQAIERAGTKAGNKGEEAAVTVLEMCDLLAKIK
jgi:6,7-dimethyl-8-ribityllumazine synthase